MLFVLIHRIIFHDKNLMDEEILKTASNASSQAMTELLSRYFLLLSLENKKNVFLWKEKHGIQWPKLSDPEI